MKEDLLWRLRAVVLLLSPASGGAAWRWEGLLALWACCWRSGLVCDGCESAEKGELVGG